MQRDNPNNHDRDAVSDDEPTRVSSSWTTLVDDRLAQAARISAAHGVDLESYVRAAWAAYVDAHPGMREQMEEAALRGQLEDLRARGLIANA